jgi:micrococcal nuclease
VRVLTVKRCGGALLIVLAALTLAWTAIPEKTAVLVGRVTGVVDGDTLDVQLSSGSIRVRLHAVDAPEKTQSHGKAATATLTSLVLNKHVQIEPFEQDRYERLVGIVYLGDLNVNAELVARGYAWAYRHYMRRADATLCKLEADARSAKRGLWSARSDEIEAPWEWRNKKLKYVTDFSTETERDCVASIGK